MKNRHEKINLAICLIVLIPTILAIGFYLGNKKEQDIPSEVYHEATKKFNSSILRKYGKYNQKGEENSTTLFALQFEILSKKDQWEFSSQKYGDLTETDNMKLPFIKTQQIVFKNKKDEDLRRILYKTYVYHLDYGWLPLATNLYETAFNSDKNNKVKTNQINESLIWKGDWEVPYSKVR